MDDSYKEHWFINEIRMIMKNPDHTFAVWTTAQYETKQSFDWYFKDWGADLKNKYIVGILGSRSFYAATDAI